MGKKKKKHKKRAPVNLFTENHLYTIKFEGEKNFSIEQNLSKIEGKFANVMREIKKKKPLSDHDHAHFCIFIATQLQRTLRFKKNQENFSIITESKEISDLMKASFDLAYQECTYIGRRV